MKHPGFYKIGIFKIYMPRYKSFLKNIFELIARVYY